MRMKNKTTKRTVKLVIPCIFFCLLIPLISCQEQVKKQVPKDVTYTGPWADEINAFAQQDKEQGVTEGRILFTGSSSIRMWNLDKYFAGMQTLNRGFGGSEISHAVRYFDRLVTIHEPSVIVFYAGENDIANGKSPEQVFQDLKLFHNLIQESLPNTKLIYISAKPSPLRWQLWPKFQQLNRLIEEYTQIRAKITFLDISKPMLLDDSPREELFLPDKLHLNHYGYEIWSELLIERLKRLKWIK